MDTTNTERIIVLVDMDCFYVQVEQKLCPEFQNIPCAVVQYKQYKGGGIIAVNYEARAKGVSRMLRGDEAKKMCPEIHLFRVPEVRGKADLTRYREAGARVLDVLCEYSDCVERASIDEAYLDMTSIISEKMQNITPITAEQIPNTFVVGWENENPELRKAETQKWLQMIYEEQHLYNDRMLAVAAVIVEEMRAAVFERTGYRCSAGIAHNKMLAKLSCSVHKPNKQTLLPQSSIQILYSTIASKKVRNLGGKFGEEIVKKLNIEKMSDLFHIPKSQLLSHFGEKSGRWLYNLARGIENEPVTSRQLPKSIGCGKNFPGKTSLSTKKEVVHWLKQLSSELEERLLKDQENNRRVARLLTVTVRNYENNNSSVTSSRSCPIYVYNSDKLAHDSLSAISKLNTSSVEELWKPSIWTLSMVASKFEDKLDNSYCNIQSYFSNNKDCSDKEDKNTIQSNLNTTTDMCSEKTSPAFTKSNPWCKVNKTPKQDIISFFKKKEKLMQTCDVESSSEEIKDGPRNEKKTAESASNFEKDEIFGDNVNVESKETNESITVNRHPGCSLEQHKPVMGFFAKKLAERAAFSFDIEFQGTSTNNSVSKPLSNKNVNFVSETDNDATCSSASKEILAPASNLYCEDDDLTNLDPELSKMCDKCNKCIPVWEESEHLDYHLAMSLSNESSQSVSRQNTFNKSITIGKSNNNTISKYKKSVRKRGSANKTSRSKKQAIQTNTLDKFIKNKP